ncbi:hypothetical protein ANCCAN_10601 [Ancylostoma caninum]|uniref:3'-5' exonuclease domain-containing protein n=1 Tax=Ancylostoma caninum TaxID=29170 RepID=A0A368GK43_ANCCA|nr:hypothetical protein ANCCAN_10601 [Ancylostoma caninum]
MSQLTFEQGELEAILDNLCELYKVDLKILNGIRNNKEKVRNGQARTSFLPLAKKIFDPVPAAKLPALYVALFDCASSYVAANGSGLEVENENGTKTVFDLKELLLNVIIPYQLPHSTKAPCSHSSDASSNNKKNSKAVHYIQTPARARLEIEHSMHLIRHFLPIKLPIETKIWKQIRYILVPSNNKEKLRLLGPEVSEAFANGTISFAALTFVMKDDVLSQFISEPSAILHALYLGPLGAPTVEAFASGRSAEFRKQCRAVLVEVENAMKSAEEFSARKPSSIRDDNPELCSFHDFRRNAQSLMRDLRGETRTEASIPMGWACAALKKFARKTYIDKTWKEENLYELIWTIMCQRPNLKKFICDLLEKDFHDYGAARYWRRMQPALMHRTTIRNRNESCYDPLLPTADYLNFLSDVKNIIFVHTAADLHLLSVELKRLRDKDPTSPLIVGLDAEWSAYVANSRATILQLSLRDRIFIIDLENRVELPASALREFFDLLFLDKGILKLGFQFNEDLVQMRAAVPHCRALFEPENVVCVGRMVAELLERTEKLKDCDVVLNEVLPPAPKSDEVEQPENTEDEVENPVDTNSSQPKSPQGESVMQRTVNRGLSYMCERVLGRPLDKTEQCSVWDRRPLRSSQLRYAAMDAYCLVLIYDVCCRWAQRLDVSIEEILKQQEPIRVSPPLLSEEF